MKRLITLLGLTLLNISQCYSQIQFDYLSYPSYSLEYSHLDLDLELQEELLNGVATYSVKAVWDSTYSTVLNAARMEIVAVQHDQKKVNFKTSGDSLIIMFDQAVSTDRLSYLEIIYRTEPIFGIHRDEAGNTWTSMLPMSVSHYLPGFIHPRTQITYDLRIIDSGNRTVASAGKKSENGWLMSQTLSITDLNFAIGNFVHEEMRYGFKKIHLYYNNGVISEDEASSILKTAHQTISQLESRFAMELPYNSLSLVVLPDNRWETKQSAAAFGYIFKNGVELELQVKRIVASQWIGSYKKIEKWDDAFPEIAHLSLIVHDLNGFEALSYKEQFPQPRSLYHPYSSDYIYGLSIELKRLPAFKQTLMNSEKHLLKSDLNIFTNQDFQRIWYKNARKTFNRVEVADRKLKKLTDEDPVESTVVVVVTENLKSNVFQFEVISPDTLDDIPLQIVINEEERIDWFPLTNNRSKSIEWSSSITLLDVVSRKPDVSAEVQKPVNYWINQLRESNFEKSRWVAAQTIARFDSTADSQLILLDAIEKEQNPELKGHLITLLGEKLNGGLGTDQTFLNFFRDENESVKIGAIKAFRHYKGNEPMIASLRSILRQNFSEQVKTEALRSLIAINSISDFIAYSTRMLERDDTQDLIKPYLVVFGENNMIEQIQIYGNAVTSSDYSFSVRRFAFSEVLRFADEKKKLTLLHKMLNDNDPRLRYIAVDYYKEQLPETFHDLSDTLIQEEFDQRVAELLNN